MQNILERLMAAAPHGMIPAVWAEALPDNPAIYDSFGVRTFAEVNAHANQLVRALRRQGLRAGDSVALVCSNRAEWIEVLAANLRSGFRMTPVNWHLTADEIAYVYENCEAKAIIVETRFPAALEAAERVNVKVKISIGEPKPGYLDFHQLLAAEDASDIADPVHGNQMLYTSGTTGRPKGVHRPNPVPMIPQITGDTRAAYVPGKDVQLCAGPAYHAAPLAFDIRGPMASGVPTVMLEKWDSEGVLHAIQEYKVTHAHMVPVMFQRLLALPADVRAKYDLSSLRFLIHGAAPCPPEVKRAMIEWLGPVLMEYYAGSEGGAGFFITAEEWLAKPGSVGKRPMLGQRTRILDDNGNDLPNGQSGNVYFEVASANPFSYHKDPDKTASSHREGFFTLGDFGYFDEDDYLFLTGRTAECIISGGVNIYPQEIDNEILKHPSVEDSCTVGAPNDEFGEEVKGVIKLKPGFAENDALRAEIMSFARKNLAGFKVPRSIDFVEEIPRTTTGKLLRREVRAKYWAGRARQI